MMKYRHAGRPISCVEFRPLVEAVMPNASDVKARAFAWERVIDGYENVA